MKVQIETSFDVRVTEAPLAVIRAAEVSLAQFSEQLEACIATKLHGQFPDLELTFGPIEEEAR